MKPLRIGVYRRVSTDDQVKVFEGSLDSQKYRIDEFVRFKNVQVGANWGEIIDYYDEEGVSAGTTNRPEYQRLMTDIRKGRINMILVSDLTRLSRNLLDFCNLISELEQYKASYLSMKEQFDTSTPIGRMIVYIIIALGQFERETTSERVAINGHTRALKGLMNGGAAPLGYNRDAEKPGLLMINENESEIVQLIFKTFLEEGSRSRTVEKLNSLKIQPKGQLKQSHRRGPAEWTIKSLGNVLSNFGYIGMREVNKMYKEEDQNHLKPWQQYKIVKASWPSIIEDQAFYDAQKLIQEASKKERMRINTGEYRSFLLTGLLTCGETGLPLMGQTGTGKMGTPYRYYHYRKTPKGTSVRPRLNADDVEKKVLNELGSLLAHEGYFAELEELIEKNFKASHQTQIQQHKSIRNRLAEIEQSISTIWANQAKMNLSEEALRFTSDELNRLAEEKKNLTKKLHALGSVPEEIDAKTQALFAENQVRACMNGWAKATPNIRKRLLRRTIKEITVMPNELQIVLWTSRSEQEQALGIPFVDDTGKIVAIPRLNRSGKSSDIKKPLRNAQIESSGEVYNGRGRGT